MPIYRVRWEEVKSVVVEAEDSDEAEQLAFDHFYDKATLEQQNLIESGGNEEGLVDDEEVWVFDDTYAYEQVTGDASLARAVAQGKIKLNGEVEDGNTVS